MDKFVATYADRDLSKIIVCLYMFYSYTGLRRKLRQARQFSSSFRFQGYGGIGQIVFYRRRMIAGAFWFSNQARMP
jgi:hypothetical protein